MKPRYTRRKGNWREVIEALIHQGVKVFCWRTKEPITLENLHLVQREHEPALCLFRTPEEKRAADIPANWRFSFSAAHSIATNGTKATTKGSTKQVAAAVRRIDSGKMAVPRGLKPDSEVLAERVTHGVRVALIRDKKSTLWVRKSRGFDTRYTKSVSGKVRPRKQKRK